MTGNEVKSVQGRMWGLGDYHRFATATVWQLGPLLVDACGVAPGQRVLDVAAGSGNVAIRAALAGATVVASDLTPANFDAGRRAAEAEGVSLEWMEADAEQLPFADGEFDVVTSCFGAMFAPDHHAVARELLRVCRPGGTIGMMNFRPHGVSGRFFEILGRYAPPLPAGALAPALWGREEHVRDLFAGQVSSLELTTREYVETAATAASYADLFRETFGPMVAIRAALAAQPDRQAQLDGDFLEFVTQSNRSTSGQVEIPYEYLLVIARRGPA